MFNSKMYKKYYPIKSSFDIANMNVAEQKKKGDAIQRK